MGSFSNLILPLLGAGLVGYLLGSISFAIIMTELFIKDDVRNFGSGNAGATNVLRAAGRRASALTFVCDFIKCAASVLLGKQIIVWACTANNLDPVSYARLGMYAAGILCIIGHMYPLYFGFRGGKGVVTTSAMMAMLDWRVFLVCAVVFFSTFFWKKIVSLSSVSAALTYPVATFAITFFVDFKYLGGFPVSYVALATAVAALAGFVVTVKHRDNIKRLIKGEEKPISFKKQR